MSFNIAKENRTTKINKENCDLINKMALANYYLNLAVKSGEQSRFFSYLYSVSREYIKNSKQYEIYSNLFYNFIERVDVISGYLTSPIAFQQVFKDKSILGVSLIFLSFGSSNKSNEC
jgi:hypothetical protein